VRVALTVDDLAGYVRVDTPRVPVEERRTFSARLAVGAPVRGRVDRLADLIEPGRGAAVPGWYRTDGRWVWPEALAYYLVEYGVAPPRALTDHLLTHPEVTPVGEVGLFRAGLALSGR
jgi:hypothetical protein